MAGLYCTRECLQQITAGNSEKGSVRSICVGLLFDVHSFLGTIQRNTELKVTVQYFLSQWSGFLVYGLLGTAESSVVQANSQEDLIVK